MNKQLINDASKKLSPKSIFICSSNIAVDEEYDNLDLEQVREIQSLKGTSHLNVEELESNGHTVHTPINGKSVIVD